MFIDLHLLSMVSIDLHGDTEDGEDDDDDDEEEDE